MKNREKIAELKKVQGYREEISDLLEEIIQRTYDYNIDSINNFTIADNSIDVDYWYTCRGEHGGDNAVIPIEWLDEGFDFKAAYEEELRKAELVRIREQEKEKKRLEEERKKREELKKTREYQKYLELKKKYEGGSK